MQKGHRAWTWALAKPSCVPQAVKDDLTARAQVLVDSEFRPMHVKPQPKDTRLNYIVDISARWRGRFFYLVSKYACPGPNAMSPFFEAPFARLEYQRNGRFGLAYMRHTGQWWQVHADLTLDEALKTIREEALFQP